MQNIESGGLHAVDWALIAAYGLMMLGMGWYYSRRQNTLAEYYTGGGRMRSGFIGISLYVTLLSSITYLATPGEVIRHGPAQVAGLLSLPLSFLVVGYILIPVIMKHRVTSAYELLEANLGLRVRLLGAGMFVLLRLVWMALMLYITAIALVAIIGIGREWMPLVSAVCGMIAVMYTSAGGIRTVVFTDVVQSILLFMGAVLTIAFVTFKMGGFGWWPTGWDDNWDRQPFFSMDPNVRATFVGAVLASLIWQVCTAGSDQTAIQRYMATPDAASARRAYLITSGAGILVGLTLSTVGLALLGYVNANSGLLPAHIDLGPNADKVFPYFIGKLLPVGLSGLVVAALFAAAMSSIDSGVNSITAVVQTDFVDRAGGHRAKTEKGHLRFAKWLAFGIGVVVVAASSLMQYVPGNFLEVTAKTTNLLVTPLFALFFMALFVPFATALGAIAGCIVGVATAILIGYWDVITGQPRLSFQWISVSAVTTNLLVACLVSYFGPKGKAGGTGKAPGASEAGQAANGAGGPRGEKH